MNLLPRFVNRATYDSYDDFRDNFKILAPESFNFAYDVVDTYAREEPRKRAMLWCNDNGDSQTFTFGEIKELSDKAANVLWDLGIRKGDAVMLILRGHYHFWTILLALHRIGAIAVPASHLLHSKDIAYRVSRVPVKMVICINDERLLRELDSVQDEQNGAFTIKAVVGGMVNGWHDMERLIHTAPTLFPRPSGEAATGSGDISLIYFSSGTTGYPKMIAHNHAYPLGHILTAAFWQCVKDNGLHYTVADTGWAKSAWGSIYGQWICGSAVLAYDYETFNADHMLKIMTGHGVSTFCAPPTVYRLLVRKDLSLYDLSRLENAVTAGEPLNPVVFERFRQQTGLSLKEGYGQTELVITIATWPWLDPKPGSIGRPAPGCDLGLLKSDPEAGDAGSDGELVIRAEQFASPPGMFIGYHRDEQRTRDVWRNGIYHTGDMAREDNDGYYWFVGRNDDIIKTAGYKVGPFEVESVLMEHPAVMECAITGIPGDPVRGVSIKATIVLAPGFTPSEEMEKELKNHVKTLTAAYKAPRVVEFVPSLPKTISGKIRRVEIRDHSVHATAVTSS